MGERDGSGTLSFADGVIRYDAPGRRARERFSIPAADVLLVGELTSDHGPFADDWFDVVISEEVVEHVPTSLVANYYSEAARVLRPDGVAYYTVPHRLGPYDSHTRTWFVHYLPRMLAFQTSSSPSTTGRLRSAGAPAKCSSMARAPASSSSKRPMPTASAMGSPTADHSE
mgnify:CR=1 FL=1